MTEREVMIRAEGLRKRYGALEVLRGVSLEVARGEVVSIVGASGAGKTTLLQIIGSLTRPDGGRVTLGGVDPFALSDRELSRFRNRRVGFVFQFHHLLPEFTAFENVCLPGLIGGRDPVRGARRHPRQLDALDGDLAAHLRIPCDLNRRETTRASFRHRAITIEYELFACHVTPSPFELRLLSRSIAKPSPRVPFESEMRQRTALNAKMTRMRERTSLRWKPPRPATAPRTPKPLHQEQTGNHKGN